MSSVVLPASIAEAVAYAGNSNENLKTILDKWELQTGSDQQKYDARKLLLIALANELGFDDSSCFSKQVFEQLKIHNDEKYSSLLAPPAHLSATEVSETIKAMPEINSPPAIASLSELLLSLRREVEEETRASATSSYSKGDQDQPTQDETVEIEELTAYVSNLSKEFALINFPDFAANNPLEKKKSHIVPQIYALNCQLRSSHTDSMVASMAFLLRFDENQLEKDLKRNISAVLEDFFQRCSQMSKHLSEGYELPDPLPTDSKQSYVARVLEGIMTANDPVAVSFRAAQLSKLTETSIRILVDSNTNNTKSSSEWIYVGADAYRQGVALIVTLDPANNNRCWFRLLVNEDQVVAFTMTAGSCQCESHRGEQLGRGEGGIVFEFNDKLVMKQFYDKKDYEKEKEMHMVIAQRIKGNEFLQKALCLATNFCDKHCTLILPKLDASKDLECLLASDKIFALSECRKIAEDLGRLLSELHDLGIIHRDFKAKNIILTSDGPILLDFGLSEVLDESRKRDQIELDVKQYLWIVLQLRFHIRFLSTKESIGLMIENQEENDPDLRWDLRPIFYRLAGLSFDELIYTTTESCMTIGAVGQVTAELFSSHDIPDYDKFLIYQRTWEEWRLVEALWAVLHNGHELTCKAFACIAFAGGNYSPLRPIKSILDQIFAYYTVSIRLLLSMEPAQFCRHATDMDRAIKSRYQSAHDAVVELQAQIAEMPRVRKLAWCRFIPFIRPIIEAILHEVMGNFEGVARSLKDMLLGHPVVHALREFGEVVQVIHLFPDGKADQEVHNLLLLGRPLARMGFGLIAGGAGGAVRGLMYDGDAREFMALFDGDFRWMGNLVPSMVLTPDQAFVDGTSRNLCPSVLEAFQTGSHGEGAGFKRKGRNQHGGGFYGSSDPKVAKYYAQFYDKPAIVLFRPHQAIAARDISPHGAAHTSYPDPIVLQDGHSVGDGISIGLNQIRIRLDSSKYFELIDIDDDTNLKMESHCVYVI